MTGSPPPPGESVAAERRAVVRDSLGVALATGTYGVSFGAVSVASGLSVAQTCAPRWAGPPTS